jgi:pentose-5-phosphate-3-epimerase
MDGQIIPAVLVNTYSQIEDGVVRAKEVASRVQVDLCDGSFVTSKTWPFVEIGTADFIKIGSDEKLDVYMPYWESVDYTADLMVEDPLSFIDSLMKYGFDDIVVHSRSLPENDRQKYFQNLVTKCDGYDMTLNLAVDLKSNLKQVKELLKENSEFLNYVQVMGIREIGKQGEKFDQEVLGLIKNLKNFFTDNKIDLPIFVDGGMNEKSIVKCKEVGAEVFVVGSALGKAIDYKEEFDYLNSL